MPVVPFSTYARYCLDNDRMDCLCGLDSQDMETTLEEFWHRFRILHPQHEIFALADRGEVLLRRMLPVYSHVDEGRTYKSKAFFILSVHGALGAGTRSYNKRVSRVRKLHIKKDPMKMNFCGNSWGNQFMIFSLAREVSLENPDAMNILLANFAGDMNFVARDGITSSNGKQKLWALHIGIKGDLPALARIGELQRCFTRMPRFAHTKMKCPGICWLCLAGKEGTTKDETIEFEEFHGHAKWKETILKEPPWERVPQALQDLPVVPGEEASLLRTDLWHNWHNGLGKQWLACSFVMMATLDVLVGGSMDAKFEMLSEEYVSWARRSHIHPFLRRLTRNTFEYESMKSSPVGSWNKAAVTTHLMLFLGSFCETHVDGKRNEPMLVAIVPCLLLPSIVHCISRLCAVVVVLLLFGFRFGWFWGSFVV